MFLAILTLITALAISAVAIYYSVAGLVAIFAAAAVPIMIMGGVLEIGKLVTAVWLHKYWKQAAWWLRTYLSVAVFVLMLITSMGIFGFLSKAHIEQTSAGEESIARVETIQNEIDRQLGIVGRAENRVRQLESSEIGADENVQGQIDKEQDRIDTAYDRIKPAIAEQNNIIAGVTQLFQNELDKIDADLTTLQGYVDNGEIKKAQQMIGASADGIFGKKTAEKIGDWKEAKQAERAEWLTKIQDAANSPTVQAARKEIARLRDNADRQIEQSNLLINRLRDQLGDTSNQEEIQKNIDEQLERVRTASSEIETLTEEKIGLESEYRKLEAEVGPIKYIAEFVYGEKADNNMLEEAVRWVIIIIIFVFDPLAVLLLIASQYTFEFRRKQLQDDNGERLRLERQEFERARAQAIVDNIPPNYDPITPPEEEATVEETEEPQYEDVDQETLDKEFEVEPQKKSIELLEESKSDIPDTANRMFYPEELNKVTVQKYTEEQLDELDQQPEWQDAKQRWKDENPNETLKEYKQKYTAGIIDKLPWEHYLNPDPTSNEDDPGYIQNQEQNESSIWKTIGDK